MRVLATISGEGFVCDIKEYDDGRVAFLADADIDADGANGQNGAKAAYMSDDSGSEALANGGMGIRNGRVVGVQPWFKDIVLIAQDGGPLVLPSGVIPSKTSYRYKGTNAQDPAAYVDSETVPYIVVPPVVIERTKGVVKGCNCQVVNTRNGKTCSGIVADVGPRTKVGELSIAMARKLGIPSSPRTGGEDKQVILYTLWPDVPGSVCNDPVSLMRASGTYV